MFNYLRLFYLFISLLLTALLFKNQFDLSNYCRILTALVLYIYLWQFKGKISRNIFLLLSCAIFFSILPFVFFNPYQFDPNNIFKVFFLIVHFCYIIIFKIEGANIFLNKKIFWAFFIFIGVGFITLEIINHHLTDFVFYIYIVFTFQKIAMIWLAFNRKVSLQSYKYGIWAMLCFILSDLFYVTNIFILSENWVLFSSLKINLFYLFGQFLLFESIIAHHSKIKSPNLVA